MNVIGNKNSLHQIERDENNTKVPVKKLILHITHSDIRVDSRILKELEAHRKLGDYKVRAIGIDRAGGNPTSRAHSDIDIEIIKLLSNKTKWKPRALRHFLILLEFSLRVVRKAIRYSPDVIHCHDTVALPIGYIVKFLTGAKLVYDAHELESDKNGQTKFLSWATLAVEKICWHRVDLLVSVSPSILNWYDENLGEKKNVLVLNSPIVDSGASDSNVDKLNNNYFHNHFGIPCESLVFIYLGILTKGRGIELILNAFSNKTLDSHVVFMGSGDLSSEVEKRSIHNQNIHFHPPVKHDLVVSLTKCADVGLCFIENISLSDYYCLPNKLFEYAFSGIPVLASNFPDLKNYVDRYELGFCSDVNSESIFESIKKFENNPYKQAKTDLSDLTWKHQAVCLVEAYDNLFV